VALLAAYTFNEASGPALDSSGNGNTLTASFGFAALTRVSGHSGTGITGWPGSAVELLAPAIGQTAARTIMFWAKFDGVTGYIQFDDDDGNGRWGIDKGQGSVRAHARDAGGLTRAEVTALTTGVWHHYAGTYAAGSLKFYIDGVLVASNTLTGPILTDATKIVVGQFSTNAETHVFDDLRIYDAALTAGEIASEGGLVTTVNGAAAAALGALSGAATGTRKVLGTAASTLGALSAAAAGTPKVLGTAAASLGGLAASASSAHVVIGTASAALGGLRARATGPAGTVVATVRYRASGPSRNTRWAADDPTRQERWRVGALPLTDVFTSIYATVYGRH
jgi:hypothetical protein